MNGVSGAGNAAGPTRSFNAAGGPATAPEANLLPVAGQPSLGQLQGSMAALYLLMGQLRDNQLSHSKTQVEAGETTRKAAEEERQAALDRAREAADEGGFFDWLSEDIGLAGAVGLVTFNYALVAADIAAHKLDIVDNVKIDIVDVGAVATGRWDVLAADVLLRKTDLAPQDARDLLEKVGIPKDAPGLSDEDVKPIAKKLLLANLAIVGVGATVLTGGTGAGLCLALAGLAISAAGQQVAEHQLLDPLLGKGSSQWIGLGMQVGGAVTAGMSGFAPGSAAIKLGAKVSAKAAGAAINGASTALQGVDQVTVAVQTAKVDHANIAAENAKMQLTKIERMLDFIIEGIKESQKSQSKAAETLQGAIQTADQTQMALARGTRV